MFTLCSGKSAMKNEYWQIFLEVDFFIAHLPSALQIVTKLMQKTPFYFKLNFLVEKLNKLYVARYFIKVTAYPSFT